MVSCCCPLRIGLGCSPFQMTFSWLINGADPNHLYVTIPQVYGIYIESQSQTGAMKQANYEFLGSCECLRHLG